MAAETPRDECPVKKACVVGGGAFGTGLAMVLSKKEGTQISVWVRNKAQADAVNAAKVNERYMKGVTIPDNIRFTSDIREAVEGVELILLAIPTQFLRDFVVEHRSTFPVGPPIVLCAKGFEVGTLASPFDVVRDELPGKYGKYLAVLAGPSFAKEMCAWLATSVTVAAECHSVAEKVQCMMSCRAASFRCYSSGDIVGCEAAGAIKNVLAIASGACTGVGLGKNARAALICRGLSEMTHLAMALGSNGEAMSGLAGVGDLLLTCSSELSRNFTVGLRLAKGETLDQIVASTNTVAEGVATAKSLKELAEKLKVDMPICSEVYKVLYEDKSPQDALRDLTARPLSMEKRAPPPKHVDTVISS